MGILDRLFNPFSDPERGAVDVGDNLNAARVVSGAALSIDDAIKNAFFTSNHIIASNTLEEGGQVDFTSLSSAINSFKADLFAKDLYLPISSRETADYVYEGSIKRGSRCVIRIVSRSAVATRTSLLDVANRFSNNEVERRELVFDKFSVESMNESDQERYNIVETMGADFLYMFGRRPRQIVLSGTVLNGRHDVTVAGQTFSMDWKNALMRKYDKSIRGTKLFKSGDKITIHLQDSVYSGYLVNLTTNVTAQTQGSSQVTLILIVKEKTFLYDNDDKIPGTNGVPTKLTSRTLLVSDKDMVKKNTAKELNQLKKKALANIEKKRKELARLMNLEESANPIAGYETDPVGGAVLSALTKEITIPISLIDPSLTTASYSSKTNFLREAIYNQQLFDTLKASILENNLLGNATNINIEDVEELMTDEDLIQYNQLNEEKAALIEKGKRITSLTLELLMLHKEVNDITNAGS